MGGGVSKYKRFVLSMALLKLFWNYFGVWLKWKMHPLFILSPTLPAFSLPNNSSHSPTDVGTCRGVGRAAVPSEPLPGRFPPSSHILSSSSLWSSGEGCLKPPPTLEGPCLWVAPISLWYRIDELSGLPGLTFFSFRPRKPNYGKKHLAVSKGSSELQAEPGLEPHLSSPLVH